MEIRNFLRKTPAPCSNPWKGLELLGTDQSKGGGGSTEENAIWDGWKTPDGIDGVHEGTEIEMWEYIWLSILPTWGLYFLCDFFYLMKNLYDGFQMGEDENEWVGARCWVLHLVLAKRIRSEALPIRSELKKLSFTNSFVCCMLFLI